jgi:hypothetical protein
VWTSCTNTTARRYVVLTIVRETEVGVTDAALLEPQRGSVSVGVSVGVVIRYLSVRVFVCVRAILWARWRSSAELHLVHLT